MLHGSKIKRVSKACDSCRRRKIKCNGATPCINCINYKCECSYNYVEKKRAVKKKPNSLKQFESRLGRMEKLMEMFVNKIDQIPSEQLQHRLKSGTAVSLPDQGVIEFKNVPSSEKETQAEKRWDSKDPKVAEPASGAYFSSQSSFSIFSPQGLKWLQFKLNNDQKTQSLVLNLKDMHHYIHQISLSSYSKWVDPITKAQLSRLPSKEETDRSLEIFFRCLSTILFIDKQEVIQIFNTYHFNLANPKHKKKLSYSDNLIMNAILLLTASLTFDIDNVNLTMSPAERMVKNNAVLETQEKHLTNSIFFYQRICFLGEGVKAIQGIIILATYVETTLLTQTNSILITTAIRLAQEMGLNRAESFFGLSEAESEGRRRLWWFLYQLDRDSSLKSGKPIIINDADISVSYPRDYKPIINYVHVPGEENKIDIVSYNLSSEKGFAYCHNIFNVRLAKITSKSYNYLFNANALMDKSNTEILRNIEELNLDLKNFKHTMNESIRPGSNINLKPYESIALFEDKNIREYIILMLHFNYFFHLMIINRIAFKIPLSQQEAVFEDPESLPINVCLNASRQILMLAKRLNRNSVNFVSWALFYPFSAFVTIFCSCIENPNCNHSVADIKLLIDSSFQLFQNPDSQTSQRSLKWDTIDVIVRQLVKIVLKAYENETGEKLLSDKVIEDLDNIESYQRFLETGSINQKCKTKTTTGHLAKENIDQVLSSNYLFNSNSPSPFNSNSLNGESSPVAVGESTTANSNCLSQSFNHHTSFNKSVDERSGNRLTIGLTESASRTSFDANKGINMRQDSSNTINNSDCASKSQTKVPNSLLLDESYDFLAEQIFNASDINDGSHFFQSLFNLPNLLLDEDSIFGESQQIQQPQQNNDNNNNFGY